MTKGKVFLIGAGPGDPGLLTIKARDCIASADVVIYDYLANEKVLAHARPDAELIYVGKKGGAHTCPQIDINLLLIEKGEAGKIVARLKGGDPYIFGRGGEEAEDLVKAGIPFEVVPGVTSAVAAAAYAGIPLTHRSHTSTLVFITGHEDPSKDDSSIAWEHIAPGTGTMVFYMGMGNLPKITSKLIQHGRSADTPIALISWGTYPHQKTLTGTLGNIIERAKEARFKPPVIIVVGEVVGLRKQLNWFEERPLFGRKVIVTRAREQMSGFADLISNAGADVIEFPTIQINPPGEFSALDSSIKNLNTYDWLVFTSVNGVKFFKERLEFNGLDARALAGLKICCIGPATADKIRQMGIIPDLLPSEYRAEGVIEKMEQLGEGALKDKKFLIPRAKVAREILPNRLKELGAHVDIVCAYETVRPDSKTEEVEAMLKNGEIWAITFTSSSTVHNFCEMFAGDDWREMLGKTRIACIGPITAKTAREKGLEVDIMPAEYTIPALVDVLIASAG